MANSWEKREKLISDFLNQPVMVIPAINDEEYEHIEIQGDYNKLLLPVPASAKGWFREQYERMLERNNELYIKVRRGTGGKRDMRCFDHNLKAYLNCDTGLCKKHKNGYILGWDYRADAVVKWFCKQGNNAAKRDYNERWANRDNKRARVDANRWFKYMTAYGFYHTDTKQIIDRYKDIIKSCFGSNRRADELERGIIGVYEVETIKGEIAELLKSGGSLAGYRVNIYDSRDEEHLRLTCRPNQERMFELFKEQQTSKRAS